MSAARRIIAISLLFVAFSGGAVFLYLALHGGGHVPEHANLLPMPVTLPDTPLVDDGGRLFTRESLRGRQSVLFFGFTHCPDICPATLSQLALARQRLLADGAGAPDIYLVSVDPERDTPPVLAEYVAHFGAGVTGLTGSADDIAAFTRPLGIYYAKSADSAAGSGDGYSVDHAAVVLVINENAQWYALFSAPHSVDAFVHDLPILADAD